MFEFLKRYDTDKQDDFEKLPTREVKGVEVFSTGTHNGDPYDTDDLKAMVDAFGKVGFEPTIKAGHEEGQEDEKKARKVFGTPALGYVSRLYLKGKKLLADLKQVPKRFADLIESGAYKHVSAEIYWNYQDKGKKLKLPRVLKSIAILGADIPALTNLKAIESLYEVDEDTGRVFAFDDDNEFRVYDYCPLPHVDPITEYLTRYPRKSKEVASYKEAADDSEETCLKCRFFVPYRNSCTIVEGWIEPTFTSDFFEALTKPVFSMEDSDNPVKGNKKDEEEYPKENNFANDPKVYIVQKRGSEWCLIARSTGKVLGCHKTKEDALKQEAAIKARQNNENPSDKKDTKEIKEDTHMKTAEEIRTEMKAEYEAKEKGLKKEYDDKISAAKLETEEAGKKDREKLETRIQKMEAEHRSDDIQHWIAAEKRQGKIAPVEENRVRAFMETLNESKTVTFSQDDKEVSGSQMDIFKEFIDKRPSLFTELSEQDNLDEIGKTKGYANAGDEVDKRARKYMAEYKETEYIQAVEIVLNDDHKLADAYNRLQ